MSHITGNMQITSVPSNTQTLILQARRRRTAIMISPNVNQQLNVTFGKNATAGHGISVSTSEPPFVMRRDEFGDLLDQEIWAYSQNASALDVAVVEGWMEGD